VASELAPWQGEVRVSNFNALGGESGDELEEIAVEVIKGLLAQVGVPVEVECLKLAGRHRRQLHVELYVTFPEGGKPEEREAVVELMAGLAPTASAFQ
jgi:hypothetical protein